MAVNRTAWISAAQALRPATRFAVPTWLILAVALLASVAPSHASCVASTRQVRFADGSVRMKAYNCTLGEVGSPIVQVEFDRLSEAAAGSLIEGTPYKDLTTLYGHWTVLHNRAYEKLKHLFETYGVRAVGQACYILRVSSANGDSYDSEIKNQKRACKFEKRTLWYFLFPDMSEGPAINAPERWLVKPQQGRWPAGWNFFYSACAESNLLSCVTLWRPVTLEDLKNFKKDVAESERKLGAPISDDLAADDARAPDRYFRMINEVANGRLPEDFLFFSDTNPFGCGCDAGATIHVREVILHTAFLRNISNAPITVDGLIEGSDPNEFLRPYAEGQTVSHAQKDDVNPITLAPGEVIAIPMRVTFVPGESIASTFGDITSAKATYEKIKNSPNSIFSMGSDCGKKGDVRRDSFRAPTAPTARIYSYGPAVTLKGIVLSGKPIEFDRPLANFSEIVADPGYGSCPFVYAYDDTEREWVNHGKIIDAASSPAKETTERRDFVGLNTRFKIREEEPELTFVNRVRLELTLTDGRVITLKPRNRLRPEGLNHIEKIKYGAEREYDFELPLNLSGDAVVTSSFAVTGFYVRYSDASLIDGQPKQ
jgi:hypothetical protein